MKLELTSFVAKWRAPAAWGKAGGALDAINELWLPALAALHGSDSAVEAVWQRVPEEALYADQNQLTSVRLLFCALTHARLRLHLRQRHRELAQVT